MSVCSTNWPLVTAVWSSKYLEEVFKICCRRYNPRRYFSVDVIDGLRRPLLNRTRLRRFKRRRVDLSDVQNDRCQPAVFVESYWKYALNNTILCSPVLPPKIVNSWLIKQTHPDCNTLNRFNFVHRPGGALWFTERRLLHWSCTEQFEQGNLTEKGGSGRLTSLLRYLVL
jgi:hypothetical protein